MVVNSGIQKFTPVKESAIPEFWILTHTPPPVAWTNPIDRIKYQKTDKNNNNMLSALYAAF